MTTALKTLWKHLQQILPTDGWLSLQGIYAELSERLQLDEGDLRSEVGSAKQRAWQRNTRKELLNRVASGDVMKNGRRPDYRLVSVSDAAVPLSRAQTPSTDVRTDAAAVAGTSRPDTELTFSCVDIAEPPARHQSRVQRIVRDTAMVMQLKAVYDNTCQLCGCRLDIGDGHGYSEGHHLRPLGHPHDGPDSHSNVIILCPNCHAVLDLAAVELDLSRLTVSPNHQLSQDSIDYHNNLAVARRRQGEPP